MSIDLAWYDVVGSVGVLFIVCTYFLLVIRKILSTDILYSALNAAGAALILISLSQEFNFSAFLMELFWLIISVTGIILSIRGNHSFEEKNSHN
jgi:hypothetical protein